MHEQASVLVRDGVIAAMGADLDAPAGAAVVDATCLTLLPVLIDAHTRLSGEGLPRAGIAARLSLSEGTVRNNLSEAILKLGAANRTEAARFAREKGWL